MDVRIGMANAAREISFESDQKAEEIIGAIEKAAKDETWFVKFVDSKLKEWFVNVEAINFVEFSETDGRRVGFVS